MDVDSHLFHLGNGQGIMRSMANVGTIPASVQHLSKMETLDLSGNALVGKQFYGVVAILIFLTIQFVYSLPGNIPTNIGKLAFLQKLNLSSNNFEGDDPTLVFV